MEDYLEVIMGSIKDQKYIRYIESRFIRKDLPEIKQGQIITVWTKVKEKDKERSAPFRGIVIAVRGSGTNKTFTVRNVLSGVGVERIFPYHSPYIEKIEIHGEVRTRRAKLYYLRKKKTSELFK